MKQYSYIVESIFFLAAIIVCGFLNGNPGFIGYDFHPFYFVILLITVRYGYGKGVFSMLFSSAIYILFYIFQGGDINFHDLSESCYQPIAFIAFWMFIGLLVKTDKNKINKLTEDNRQQEKTLSDKETEIKKLDSINKYLSKELITSDQSFNILFKRTKNLFNEDIMVLYGSAYEILIKTIQASEAYIIYFEGDRLEIAAPENPEKDRRYFEANKEEIEEVRKTHEFFRLDMIDSRSISNQTPVFIGPIIHQPTDTLFGLTIVQELDFLKYNQNTYRTFVNFCKWLGEIFYFRTKQKLDIKPIKRDIDYNYIIEFGSTRFQIRKKVEECFS
jgi:cupin superfamily acireductone dioxygenase involved in methionine salvage